MTNQRLKLRVLVFSPQDDFLFEVSPNDVFSARMRERINGEHSLSIVTTRHLEKEQRLLVRDTMDRWREFVVMGTDTSHENGDRPFGEYRCVWSLQHDLKLCGIDATPGLDVPISAASALDVVLSGTNRWNRGTVTRSVNAGADMTQKDCWEALSILIDVWGGEVDTTIQVGPDGVTARRVNLYEKMGAQTATRRFDYARDLMSIRRKVDEMPVACRIRPYGKAQKTIDDIDVHITIEEVNDGLDYIQNDAMAPILRMPNGSGGWEYPTLNVTNTSIDDEEELLEWANSVLMDYTMPKVTYSASVSQLAVAGMDVQGVALGDLTQCVDRGFSEEGVRIESRINQIDVNLLDPSDTNLTLGDVAESYLLSVGTSLGRITSQINDLSIGATSTAEYLDNLIDHLNEQINATGGYFYVTEGYGVRTYDRAVTDPLVGAEANAVVEIRGGTIRIANSKTQTGEWNWRTVFVAGHIAADMVTAANIVTGFIGTPNGSVYIDLDNQVINFGGGATFGGQTVGQIAESAATTAYEQSAQDLATAVESINSDIADLQDQVDGNITTWFYTVDPTTSNPPANEWTTVADKKAHTGDLYYNTDSGHSWRWVQDGNTFYWQAITDSGVTKALHDAALAQDTADHKRRVFVTTPTPPYDQGDLWAQGENGDIMRCMTARAEGSYTASDWQRASKYTDDTALAEFIEGDYSDDLTAIQGQLDQKIETWYQDADPSANWTADEKADHAGDLWYKVTGSTTWRYSGTGWVKQDAPDAVFDAIDGKAQIFVSQPAPPYSVGDLWVQGTSGDIMTCVTARATGSYNASDWAKRNKYTDDSSLASFIATTYADDLDNMQAQVDGKVETWWQTTDPATAWTSATVRNQHAGDLWYNPTNSKTQRYTGTAWAEQEAPDEVFDAIDGKAQVFISTPAPPYHVGDLWFNSASADIKTCVTQRLTGSYNANDWKKRNKYTDDSALTSFISTTYATDLQQTRTLVDGKVETWYQSNDPAENWTEAQKEAHVGDLWYRTTDSATLRYSGTGWVSQEAPAEVFDAIEGKAQIFLDTPEPPYNLGDLWLQGADGDLLTCVTAKASTGEFSASDWAKRVKYTDDTGLSTFLNTTYKFDLQDVNSSLDKKAETWYQSTDPATAWTTSKERTQHKGDLWFKTTDSTTWRYSGTGWVEQTAPDAVFDAIDGKAQIFTAQPTPPYNVGDLWTQGSTGDIMTCVRARVTGDYTESDWAKRNKYTDDSSLETFVGTTYAPQIQQIQEQVDGKAETWYQAADPSTAWTTTAMKNEHKGDLWYKTGDSTTWRWSGTAWVEQKAPNAVFDAIDGKAQIFTSQPVPPYNVGDLWFNSASSDIKVCVTARASGSYVAAHWAKRDKYTDDSALTTFLTTYATDKSTMQGQIDGKVETWYQSSDPSTAWTTTALKTAHTGDLWYKTTDSTTWRYSGTSWVSQDAPKAVFDKIDGKAQVFTTRPTPPYRVGDLWFSSATSDIMTCVTERASGSYTASDWAKRNKYTDDSSLTSFISSTYTTDKESIQGQIDGKIETWHQSDDPSTAWTTSTIKTQHKGDLWYRTTDSVTMRYSGTGWVVQDAPDEVFDKIDGKAQVFISQPVPPYNVGDLWFDSATSDIKTCVTARYSGSYVASHWVKRNKYTDDSALTSFLTTYANDKNNLQGQIDGKAETWYQSADPSTSWTTDTLKAKHVGDLWYRTTDAATLRYNGTSWVQQNVPNEVFDKIDGKAQIFISQPTPPYHVGDLWFDSSTSDIMTCTRARATGSYTSSDWAKRNKYTDDTALTTFVSGDFASTISDVRGQIDKKAETWYQSSDPSTAWTTTDLKNEHKGDLWYKTGDSTTWRWNGTAWVEQAAPDAVFDKIDGKAQVFTAQPVPPYGTGDVWFKGASGDIMTCITSRASGSYTASDWSKLNKYTDDTAANAASTAASNAAKTATNYLTYSSSNGLSIGYTGTSAKARITGDGLEVYDGRGTSALFAGIQSDKPFVRIGRLSGSSNITMSGDGEIDLKSSSTTLAHFGYGEGTNPTNGSSTAPYYNLGVRKSGSTIGNYSVVEGMRASSLHDGGTESYDYPKAAGYAAHAEGVGTTADGNASHAEGAGSIATRQAAHAEGKMCEATAQYAHAEGYYCKAQAQYSHVGGQNSTCASTYVGSFVHGSSLVARATYSAVFGMRNIASGYALAVGRGDANTNTRADIFHVDVNGNTWIKGQLSQDSDRRLKEHHAYLGEDACEFVRQLRPALFTKDGKRHVGFYAQDVQQAEPDEWDTVTVEPQHTDEAFDFDPLTLDYTALIAPLVAYAQHLEERVEKLEQMLLEQQGTKADIS